MVNHGGSGTAEYKAWGSMRDRCLNPTDKHYPNYGGRGIKICPLWLSSYPAFLEFMGRRPSPQHSLDRYPDNDGNYEPGNVRWATKKEQALNRRDSRILTFNGRSQNLQLWADEIGIDQSAIWLRIYKYGWSIDRALTSPSRKLKGRQRQSEVLAARI